MPAEHTLSPTRLALGVGAFVLAGFPLVAYLWETLNRLMAGIVEPVRLLITLVVLALFAGLLRLLARWIAGREEDRREVAGSHPSGDRP